MPSTLFPLPIAVSQLKRHFAGLGDVLEAMAEYSGMSVEEIAAEHIRASQFEIEQQLQIPYFITRYTTEEVAAHPGGSSGRLAPPEHLDAVPFHDLG